MSRPKPCVLIEWINKTTFDSEQVLLAEAIYSVFYKNKPINLRSVNMTNENPINKYKKVSFGNPGHAFNLAEKLNKLFKTDAFVVVKLTQGEIITENPEK